MSWCLLAVCDLSCRWRTQGILLRVARSVAERLRFLCHHRHPDTVFGASMQEESDVFCCWRKSSTSATSECLELACSGESVLVRDSKEGRPSILKFTPSAWWSFLSRV